jgi:hypothetical protein
LVAEEEVVVEFGLGVGVRTGVGVGVEIGCGVSLREAADGKASLSRHRGQRPPRFDPPSFAPHL